MSSLKYWVWISAKVGLRPAVRHNLITAFGDPEKLYFADESLLQKMARLSDAERALVLDKSLDRAERILESCYAEGVTVLTINDAAYPERLRNIYDPPVVLYIKGRLPAVDEHAVIGVVGTRDSTPYGIKMGKSMGFELTRGGGLVTTGLAEGVDSAAAEGALRAGGSCIGVLGCAIDRVYPAFNKSLYRDVGAVGALISEYPPGTEGDKRFFPERNRIISGISVGIVVIEAPLRSGSLITARLALEQGREVFAVPGNADAPGCAGSNNLISDGAALVTNGGQVISAFIERFPQKLSKPQNKRNFTVETVSGKGVYPAAAPAKNETKTEKTGAGFVKLRVRNERKVVDKPQKREYIDLREQLSGMSETQLKIVSAMDENSKHIDDIIDKTQLDAGTVLSGLTMLQIKGVVTQEPGKRFSLNIIKR